MKPIRLHDERPVRGWFFRIASLVAIVAVIAAISLLLRRGDTTFAILLILTTPLFAVALAWCWTGSLFAPFEWAKRYVEGAEGDHRHEWYAFRGQRVRVFLDQKQQPWFALDEIAFILSLKGDELAFRDYGPHECGTPESAPERCL